MSKRQQSQRLAPLLNGLYESYLADFQESPGTFFTQKKDPLSFAHHYTGFHDVEIAGFLAATFAYGNVQSLCGFVERLLRLLGPSPYKFLMQGDDAVASLTQHSLYYRLQKTEDILSLLSMLSEVYRKHGSLYEVFLESYYDNNTMYSALSGFVQRLYEIHGSPIPFLLPSPESGSPCKRLNLFLRWMVRNDGLDMGIWDKVSPARLIIPLDTHIGRVSLKLGWIRTPSLSWKKAEAVTEILRKFNPADPVRYDFALCHESISRNAWLKRLVL